MRLKALFRISKGWPVISLKPVGMNLPITNRIVAVIAVGGLVSACATFSKDEGMDAVANVARVDLHANVVVVRTDADEAEVKRQVKRLLARPLTASSAVAIALLNNKGLQASYNELGIAEARRVRDSLPPAPSIEITAIGGAAEFEIERKLTADILALATLPVRSEIATERFRQAQLRAALETLRVAAEARRSYYTAVGAREIVGVLRQAKTAAESTAQLAEQLGKTGSLNKLDQAREQAFYAETTTNLAVALENEQAERERLVRALGLWDGDAKLYLPNRLPALPKVVGSRPLIEVEAVRNNIDLQIARIELDALAKSYGLTNATRFINVLNVGADFKTTHDKQTGDHIRDRGIAATFELPIYDFGEARRREAEQTYMQAVNLLLQKAVNARSEAREAYRRYRASYDIARHYQNEILPLQRVITDESQLRFSSMLIDVFALLTEARERIAATRAAVEAKQDFWMADSALSTAVAGGGSGGSGSSRQSDGPAASGSQSSGAGPATVQAGGQP